MSRTRTTTERTTRTTTRELIDAIDSIDSIDYEYQDESIDIDCIDSFNALDD